MPPRKKKPTFGGAQGGALQSLGGAFGRKGKKTKNREVAVILGGLTNTLGWLWKDSKPLPKNPPKPDADEDDEEEDQTVRSLPSFIKLCLIKPGSGSEFKKIKEESNHAIFEVSSNLRISEFRTRLMDFFGEWQELKPSQDDLAKAANKARKSKTGAAKGKEKAEAKPFKHKAPIAQKLITGRQIWSNQTKIGDIVTFVGGGGGDGTGDCGSMHAYLPWSGHGTELMRYGPVVIILQDAELDVQPLDSDIEVQSNNRPPTTSNRGGDVKALIIPQAPAVRTASTWFASNGEAHLVPQKPIHLISDSTSDAFKTKTNPAAIRLKKNKEIMKSKKSNKKVSPDYEVMTTSIIPHEPLGLDHARVNLKAISLNDVQLSQPQ